MRGAARPRSPGCWRVRRGARGCERAAAPGCVCGSCRARGPRSTVRRLVGGKARARRDARACARTHAEKNAWARPFLSTSTRDLKVHHKWERPKRVRVGTFCKLQRCRSLSTSNGTGGTGRTGTCGSCAASD